MTWSAQLKKRSRRFFLYLQEPNNCVVLHNCVFGPWGVAWLHSANVRRFSALMSRPRALDAGQE